MVLCDKQIRTALKKGLLIVRPEPPPEHIATTAIDLQLGDEFRRWRDTGSGLAKVVDPTAPEFDYRVLVAAETEPMPVESDGAVLSPITAASS